jgi:hypothetical protein
MTEKGEKRARMKKDQIKSSFIIVGIRFWFFMIPTYVREAVLRIKI